LIRVTAALNIVAGGVLSKPTKLGEKMGLGSSQTEEPLYNTKKIRQSQTKENIANENRYEPLSAEEQIAVEREYQAAQEAEKERLSAKTAEQIAAEKELELKAKTKEAKKDEYYANTEFEAGQQAEKARIEAEKAKAEAQKLAEENKRISEERQKDFEAGKAEVLKEHYPISQLNLLITYPNHD
jgi:hypothetical protein